MSPFLLNWLKIGLVLLAAISLMAGLAYYQRRTIVHAEGRLVAAVGVSDLVIVATPDAVLVLPRDRAQDVRHVVDRIKEMGEEDLL